MHLQFRIWHEWIDPESYLGISAPIPIYHYPFIGSVKYLLVSVDLGRTFKSAMQNNMDLSIQILSTDDYAEFEELLSVFIEVFEMENFQHPNSSHLIQLLNQKNFIAIIAKSEGKVIGGLTIYTLVQYYSEKPLAYLYDLAVLSKFQRIGVGKQLMAFAKEHCQMAGYEELFVQADKIDAHAIDFYRLTNPTSEEPVLQFSYRFPAN